MTYRKKLSELKRNQEGAAAVFKALDDRIANMNGFEALNLFDQYRESIVNYNSTQAVFTNFILELLDKDVNIDGEMN